jgi:hypothetical protein
VVLDRQRWRPARGSDELRLLQQKPTFTRPGMRKHPGRSAFQARHSKEKTMKFIVKKSKPRNPFVVASLQRAAGSHRRTAGGLRQQAQRSLRQELAQREPLRQSP